MLTPSGQVQPTRTFSSPAAFGLGASFYHFWIAERDDLHAPQAQAGVAYTLPMMAGVSAAANPTVGNGFPASGDAIWGNTPLRGENRLLTLYTRTGNIVVNQVVPSEFIPATPTHAAYWTAGFLGTSVDQPYINAELGTREVR